MDLLSDSAQDWLVEVIRERAQIRRVLGTYSKEGRHMDMDLVVKSWELVRGQGALVSEIFYANLFEVAPELRPMFPRSMERQHEKLFAALDELVMGGALTEDRKRAFRALGARHRLYGVEPHQFELVGRALLKTLVDALGDRLDDATYKQWAETYWVVAGLMIEGVRA